MNIFISKGKKSEAIKCIKNIIASVNLSIRILLIEGFKNIDSNNYDGSINCFQKILEIEKDNVLVLYLLAFCNEKLHRFRHAELHYNDLLKLEDNFASGFFKLGEVQEKLHKIEESKKNLKKAKVLNPSNPDIIISISRHLPEKEKFEYLNNGINLFPDYPFIYIELGSCYFYSQKHYEKSEKMFKKAKLLFKNYDLLNRAGICHTVEMKSKNSLELINSIRDLDRELEKSFDSNRLIIIKDKVLVINNNMNKLLSKYEDVLIDENLIEYLNFKKKLFNIIGDILDFKKDINFNELNLLTHPLLDNDLKFFLFKRDLQYFHKNYKIYEDIRKIPSERKDFLLSILNYTQNRNGMDSFEFYMTSLKFNFNRETSAEDNRLFYNLIDEDDIVRFIINNLLKSIDEDNQIEFKSTLPSESLMAREISSFCNSWIMDKKNSVIVFGIIDRKNLPEKFNKLDRVLPLAEMLSKTRYKTSEAFRFKINNIAAILRPNPSSAFKISSVNLNKYGDLGEDREVIYIHFNNFDLFEPIKYEGIINLRISGQTRMATEEDKEILVQKLSKRKPIVHKQKTTQKGRLKRRKMKKSYELVE